jgi:DNA invertase Pin-like site-specific DNA recombinase
MFESDVYLKDSIAYIINSDMDSDTKVNSILMLMRIRESSLLNTLKVLKKIDTKKIRERQRKGIEQAKKRGAFKGRPTKFSEDSSDREGRLVFDGIKKDYQAGNYKSKAGLARKYGLSRQQLYRIINRIEQR